MNSKITSEHIEDIKYINNYYINTICYALKIPKKYINKQYEVSK